jgi:hypothetical protein
MSENYRYQTGLGSVGSYQISGIPWVTSSIAAPPTDPLEIAFPYITKSIIVKNVDSSGTKLRVGFSVNGVKNTNNYFLLGKDESFACDLRVAKLYLLSDGVGNVAASLVCGLTGILPSNLESNWSGSVGVG